MLRLLRNFVEMLSKDEQFYGQILSSSVTQKLYASHSGVGFFDGTDPGDLTKNGVVFMGICGVVYEVWSF